MVIKSDFIRINAAQLNRAVINEHIDEYRTIVRRDPHDEKAHYGLGVAYFNLGLLDEAADELAQAARLRPENPHIQTQLAVIYSELAQRGKADASALAADRVERALLLDPKLADALAVRARLAGRRGDWKDAVQDLRLAAQSDPASANPKLGTALARVAEQLRGKGQWTGAVTLLRESIALNPDAARPQISAILQVNQQFLTNALVTRLADPGFSTSPGAVPSLRPRSAAAAGWSAGAKTLGVAFAVLIIALIIVGAAPSRSTLSSAAAIVALLAFVGIIASPIAGIVVWLRAREAGRFPSPTVAAQPPHRPAVKVSRAERDVFKANLLAGTTLDAERLLIAAHYVAQARQQADELEARRKRTR